MREHKLNDIWHKIIKVVASLGNQNFPNSFIRCQIDFCSNTIQNHIIVYSFKRSLGQGYLNSKLVYF